MSESIFPTFRAIRFTPMRDLVRLRLSQRLDWKAQVASQSLPTLVREVIVRVVTKTRLWRLEKAAVAGELAAHFLDALDAGTEVREIIQAFGDERVAAQLIRRSKRRGRTIVWHLWKWCCRGTALLVGIYSIFLIRFFVQRPTISFDYVARLNSSVNQSVQSDRAWPIWRKAIFASTDGVKEGSLHFAIASPFGWDPQNEVADAEKEAWIQSHADVINAARAAGKKATLGFVFGTNGSVNDPALFPELAGKKMPGESQPAITVELPHLHLLRGMAETLSLDARLSATRGDGRAVESDLVALHGLGRQLRDSRTPVVNQLVGIAIGQKMIDRFEWTLEKYPAVWSDEQLVRMAHLISTEKVAADLIDLEAEQAFFSDTVQRIYTDDGSGSGHLTMQGVNEMRHLMMYPKVPNVTGDDEAFTAIAPLPMVIASRADLTIVYTDVIRQYEANFTRPIWTVDVNAPAEKFCKSVTTPTGRLHYSILAVMFPNFSRLEGVCETYLGARDAAEAAISLEFFHRRHGAYPQSLNELTAEYLPSVPVDRITGEAVKYRLVDGKPIIYSVGADRVDDGGKWPEKDTAKPAQWGIKISDAPRGDWVLYPPRGMDSE